MCPFQDEFSCKTFHMWAEHIFIEMVRTKTRFEKEAIGSSEVPEPAFHKISTTDQNTHALGMSVFADLETVSYEDHEETNTPEVFN